MRLILQLVKIFFINQVLRKFQNISKEKFATKITNNFYTIFNQDKIIRESKRSSSLKVNRKFNEKNTIINEKTTKIEVDELLIQANKQNEYIKLLIDEKNDLKEKVKLISKFR